MVGRHSRTQGQTDTQTAPGGVRGRGNHESNHWHGSERPVLTAKWVTLLILSHRQFENEGNKNVVSAAAGGGTVSVSFPTCGGVVVRCRESSPSVISYEVTSMVEGAESLSKLIQFYASWKNWAQIHSQAQYKLE